MLKLEYDEFGYITTTINGTFQELVDQAFSLVVALLERMDDGKAGATLLIAALANYFEVDREIIEETRKHINPLKTMI